MANSVDIKLDKEYIKKYEELMTRLLDVSKSIQIPRNNDIFRLLYAFLERQKSLVRAIYKLAKEDFYYEGCIVLTTLIENYILQKWLIREGKIMDYFEFGVTESLPRLALYPQEKDEVLQFIKEHNVKRFLKKSKEATEENLLNKENYKAPWQNLTNITKHLIQDDDGRSEVKDLKKAYDFACGYKHSSPYAVLSRIGYDMVPQDAFLLYTNAIYAFICNLVLIDQCCNFEGLKKILKDLYIQFNDVAANNPILKNELKNIQKSIGDTLQKE